MAIIHCSPVYVAPLKEKTKIMNEGWACLDSNSLLLTKIGFIRYKALHDLLAKNEPIAVGSGGGLCDQVVDRHIRHSAPTIRLCTRRGLTLEGAEEHKLS